MTWDSWKLPVTGIPRFNQKKGCLCWDTEVIPGAEGRMFPNQLFLDSLEASQVDAGPPHLLWPLGITAQCEIIWSWNPRTDALKMKLRYFSLSSFKKMPIKWSRSFQFGRLNFGWSLAAADQKMRSERYHWGGGKYKALEVKQPHPRSCETLSEVFRERGLDVRDPPLASRPFQPARGQGRRCHGLPGAWGMFPVEAGLRPWCNLYFQSSKCK